MRWSFCIGTVRGTRILVHFTLVLFIAWLAMAFYAQGGSQAALRGVAFILLLFACVALHEFGHILTARRFGIATPDVVLLPIGGMARLEQMPQAPREELLIALAGPAVSLALALVFGMLAGDGPGSLDSPQSDTPGLLAQLAAANLFLAIFNLLPAFPMDGGRVLRAVLSARLGHARGTRIAAVAGQALAILFGFAGLMLGHAILVLVALFIFLAAGAEAGVARLVDVTTGMTAGDLMTTDFVTLGPEARIADAAQLLTRTDQREFPIVEANGHLLGVLTREGVIAALGRGGEDWQAGRAAERELASLSPDADAAAGIQLLQQGAPAVPVLDPDGGLLGLLTWDNLRDHLLVAEARRKPLAPAVTGRRATN
jgi:stage IV sporulation protein FB